eukprot:5356007-Amphidinium_carterae.1
MTGARVVLTWPVELDPSTAANAAGAAAEPSLQTTVAAAQELAEQLYTVLMSLTDGEADGSRSRRRRVGTQSPQAGPEDF